MKKTSISRSTVVALALALAVPSAYFIGCDTKPQVSPGTEEEMARADLNAAEDNLESAKEDYDRELENFRQQMAERSAANEQAIASLKEVTARQKEEARAAYREKVAQLELKNTEMKVRLNEYKGEGNEKWARFKAEFNHDMDELGRAIRDIGKDNVK